MNNPTMLKSYNLSYQTTNSSNNTKCKKWHFSVVLSYDQHKPIYNRSSNFSDHFWIQFNRVILRRKRKQNLSIEYNRHTRLRWLWKPAMGVRCLFLHYLGGRGERLCKVGILPCVMSFL